MKKRIYRNMFTLTAMSIIIASLLLIINFYNLLNTQMETEVKNQAIIFEKSLNYSEDKLNFINAYNLPKYGLRINVIDNNGLVIFDNQANIYEMENHLNRPEIKEAFSKGSGEITRFSNTIGEKTFYYAIKLNDNTVLRVSKTTNSVNDILKTTLPTTITLIMISFILCDFFARKLTSRIVAPINNFDLNKDQISIYEELNPFIKTIKNQKHELYEQFIEIENRTNTLNTIIVNMKEGILIVDKSGLILAVNNSVLKLFHLRLNNYIGKNSIELSRNMELQNGIRKTLVGQTGDFILYFEDRIVQVFLSPVIVNNNINGVIAFFLDITEKANAEKIRKEFSANVSHELKTPLTTISGYAEMMHSGMIKTSDFSSISGKIKNESARLIDLIEDIIKISELDENTIEAQFVKFDLLSVAIDVVSQLKPLAEKKQIELSIQGNKTLINANNKMIYEMLYNLVDNGIKYNKNNGTVIIKIETENNKTKIEIIDTGIGISQSHIDRIYERFYRVDKSRSKKTGGSGLGLSIVKHIVQYHKGTLTTTSAIDKGTQITIIL